MMTLDIRTVVLAVCCICNGAAKQTRGMLPIEEGSSNLRSGGEKVFLLGEMEPTVVLSAGLVESFEAWIGEPAPLTFQVWRPKSGDQYELVGQVRVPDDSLRKGHLIFPLDPSERFTTADGDALGFYAHTQVIPVSASFNTNSKIKQVTTLDGEYAVGDIETFDDIPYPYSFAFAVNYDEIEPTTQATSTQLPTTSEPATQPQTTTNPATNTSTTTQKTAQPPTTTKLATHPPTTTQQATQPPTTIQQATQPPTTIQQVTQPTITTKSATQPPTTTKLTTEPSTTTKPATQPPTTTQQATQPPTTTQQVTQLPITTKSATQPPTTTKLTTEPSTTTEPATQTQATTTQATQSPITTKPTTHPSTTTQQVTQPPTTIKSATQPPSTTQQATQLPTTTTRPTQSLTTTQSATQPPTTTHQATQSPTTTKPATQPPTTTKPATQPPVVKDPESTTEMIAEFGNPRASGPNTGITANQAWILQYSTLLAGNVNRFEFRSATNLVVDQNTPLEVRMQIWRPISGPGQRKILIGEEKVAVRQPNLLHTVYSSRDGGIQVLEGDLLGFTELSQTGVIARNNDLKSPRSKTRMFDYSNDGNGEPPVLYRNYSFGHSQSQRLFSIAVFIDVYSDDSSGDGEYDVGVLGFESPNVEGNLTKPNDIDTSLGSDEILGCHLFDYKGEQKRLKIVKLGDTEVLNDVIFDSNDIAEVPQGNFTLVADKYIMNPKSGLYILNIDTSDAGRYRCLELDSETVITDYIANLAVKAFSCDFEVSSCGLNLSSHGFKWKRNKGETQTRGTGPSWDHTSGNGYYLYTDVSPPVEFNDQTQAVLNVKGHNNTTEDGKLMFFYHAFGQDVGKLDVMTNSSDHQVVSRFHVLGPQENSDWRYAEIDIPVQVARRDFDIIFEVTRGKSWKGDVAIDDLMLVFGEGYTSYRKERRTSRPYIQSGGGFWIPFPKSYLPGNNDVKLTNMARLGCLQACVQYAKFYCKSVDYVQETSECMLSSSNHNDPNTPFAPQYHPFIDYYERLDDEPTTSTITPTVIVNTPAFDDVQAGVPVFTIEQDTIFQNLTILAMVTDTSIGRPAHNMTMSIYYNHHMSGWTHIHTSITDTMGKAGMVLEGDAVRYGAYKAQLHSASYFAKLGGKKPGFPYIEIIWELSSDLKPLYYFPVLVNPYSYTVSSSDMMDLMDEAQTMFSL